MKSERDSHDRTPTPTSTALVLLVVFGTAAALVRAADVVWPALVGCLGAVALAALVRASGWERRRALGSVVAGALVLPVGVGVVGATAGTVLVLVESLFPVPTAADFPATVVRLTARGMVVAGSVVAVFGAVAASRGTLERETVGRAATNAVRTAAVPFLAGGVLALQALLGHLEGDETTAGLGGVVGDALRAFGAAVFRPDAVGPHLPTFPLLVGLALLAVQRGLRALPVTELLDGGGRSDRRVRFERCQRRLFGVAVAVLSTVPVAVVVHVLRPPRQLRAALGPAAFDALAAVTTSPALRSLAWWLVVVGFAVATAVWLLRRFVRTSPDRIGSVLGPFAAGAAVVGLAGLLGDRVLAAAVAWVAGTLPGEFAASFTRTAESVVAVFGAVPIVVSGAALVTVLAALTVTVLWAVLAVDYVEERTAGVAVASLALVTAAAFAGVLAVSNALVLGALVAALFVWDAGEFGVALGEEIGSHAGTRRAELVHATGSLAVGGVGAGAALLLDDLAAGAATVETGAVALGLFAVVGGLLALVLALR